jgi:hypothetical protein
MTEARGTDHSSAVFLGRIALEHADVDMEPVDALRLRFAVRNRRSIRRYRRRRHLRLWHSCNRNHRRSIKRQQPNDQEETRVASLPASSPAEERHQGRGHRLGDVVGATNDLLELLRLDFTGD